MSRETGFVTSILPGLAMLGLVLGGIVSGQLHRKEVAEAAPAVNVETQLREAAGGLAVQVLTRAHAILSTEAVTRESIEICDETEASTRERIKRSF